MKKRIVLASMLFAAVCSSSFANTSEYFADDFTIERTINSGEKLDFKVIENNQSTAAFLSNSSNNTSMPTTAFVAERNATVAFVLSWFVGFLGVHRFYMGTATLTGVGYILTLGGCGIVAFVDWVVLLIALINQDGIEKYEDNPKFFMWSGK
jgi:TM2 domain-containing membrane protein YozV